MEGYAIYGNSDGLFDNAFAGWFEGNVHVNGILTESSSSFKIDHPSDPENKFLIHSAVESPEMLNIYRGTVTTDSNGEAIAVLPPYFEITNINFDYQLTIIGQFAQAIVAKEISDNAFTIRTDKPMVKVSWLVIGTRNDEYAKMHPIIPEQEKNTREKGKFLNPELFGAGDQKSIGKWNLKKN